MGLWTKKPKQLTEEDLAAMNEMDRETAEQLANERRFWDDSVQYMLPEDQTPETMIRIMDKLLEARRERFGG